MRNNELKYRKELFELLKDSFGEVDENELKLLEDLILSDNVDNKEMLKRIKNL